MKNAFAKVLSFATVVTVGLSASAATTYTVEAGNADDLYNKVLAAASGDTVILPAGVYDFTGKTPKKASEVYSGSTDNRSAFLIINGANIKLRGENTKHWSKKTREEESIIKGNGTARLLYGFMGGRQSTISHLTFEDGNSTNSEADQQGGAVYYMGPSGGYVTNCVFRNCKAKNGGGTHSISSYDCLYENCTATSQGGGAWGEGNSSYTGSITNRYLSCVFNGCSAATGGGLFAQHIRLLGNRKMGGFVEECVFSNNTATTSGGAIGGTDLDTIVNCRFENNKCSTGTGGAIYLSTACDGVVSNCTFIGNSSRGGGAVGKCDYIYDSVFTDNWSTNNGAKSSGGGGAIASALGMFGCTFSNNITYVVSDATMGGGAAYNCNGTNCRFENNGSTYKGGAVFSTTGTGNYTNCQFVGNISTNHGGAAYQGTYVNCEFNGNTCDSGGGGAIANALGMFDCTFSNNIAYVVSDATMGGGAAYKCNGTNCRFENNCSTYYGGAVANGTYTNCQFVGNISTNHGGAAYQGTYVNCEFNGNTCDSGGSGGACYSAKCYDCKIVNNKVLSARAGGVSQSTCFDCVFSNNCCSSSARGGAAAHSKCTRCKFYGIGDVSIGCYADCEFDGIVANSGKYQSFVFDSLENSGGNIYITNCLVHNCNVAQIFHCDGRVMEAVNCTIVDNTVSGNTVWCNRGRKYNPTTDHVSTNRLINCLFANNKGSNGTRMDLSVWADVQSTVEGPLCTNELYNCMYEEGTSFTGGLVKKDCFQGKARFNKGSRSDQPYYALRYTSDAKNKGKNFSWMETGKDMAGKPRIFDDGVNIVDIGCYECDLLPLGLILRFQ